MPRRLRLRIPNVPLHVMQRGVDRAACFRLAGDQQAYLDELAELSEEFRCAVHAYVLMTNHVHMLVTPSEADSCSRMMKHLGQRYAQHCNREWGRTGPLWEGRFRSHLVGSDGYFLRCQRYIELNPIRAGMVAHPAAFPWSSYRANAWGMKCEWLTPHSVYLGLGREPVARRRAYRELFKEAIAPEHLEAIRDSLRGGFALGSPEFIARVESSLGERAVRKKRVLVAPAMHQHGAKSGLTP